MNAKTVAIILFLAAILTAGFSLASGAADQGNEIQNDRQEQLQEIMDG